MAYKIYADDVCICNSNIDESMVINPVIVREANMADGFSFYLAYNHQYYDFIQSKKTVIKVVDGKGNILFIGTANVQSIDFFKRKKVECEGILAYLNDSILRQAKYTNMNVLTLLRTYIDKHNEQVEDKKKFQVGQVTVTATETILRYTNMQSTLTEISEDLVDNYGGFVRARYENNINYIDYLQNSPRTCSQVIRLGVNLLDYSSNINSVEIATRIIPQGATLDEVIVEGLDAHVDITSVNDGKDYLEAPAEIIERYGLITKVVTWDNVNVPSILKSKAEAYFHETQFDKVVIECSAVDLGYVDSTEDKFQLLDTVRIISEPHGMDKNFVLTKMTMHLNEPEKDTFRFGITERTGLSARTNSINATTARQIAKVQPSSILEAARQNATNLIAGASGGNVVIESGDDGKPWRILIMDTDNKDTARSVLQLNRNGIGFSTNGINGPYNNAWTIDGNLVADFITSGTLNGVKVIAEKGEIGSWNISDTGADKGALYADVDDRRVWIHAPGLDATGVRRYILSSQKLKSDGQYDVLFALNDNGHIATRGNINTYNSNGVNSAQLIADNGDNAGAFNLRKSDGTTFFSVVKSTSDSGFLSVKDADGKDAFVIAGGTPLMQLFKEEQLVYSFDGSAGTFRLFNDGNVNFFVNSKTGSVYLSNDGTTFLQMYKTTSGSYVNFMDNHWVGRTDDGTAIQSGDYRLTLEETGDLVLTNKFGQTIWHTDTAGR